MAIGLNQVKDRKPNRAANAPQDRPAEGARRALEPIDWALPEMESPWLEWGAGTITARPVSGVMKTIDRLCAFEDLVRDWAISQTENQK